MKTETKDTVLYKIVRPIIKFGIKILYRPKIIGKENIPREGKIILAGNHTSNFDCLLLMSSTKRPIHFLAKKELWKGLKKIIFANMGLIPVDRKKKDHQSIEQSINYLNDDKVIGIFPEGTTEKEGMMLPFKMGVIKIAKEANSKIIPFAISGKYRIFSNNLKIIFGKSYSLTSDDLEKELENLKKQIKKLIEVYK